MGCCCSEIDQEENLPHQNTLPNDHSRSKAQQPLHNNPSFLAASPQKLLQPPINGETLRLQGNEHFKRKQFALAIQAYKKALSLPNPSAAYFSNLALAYKANGEYEKSIAIVDQMNNLPSLRTYQHAGLFRKAQIVKARCIIIQVRDYCLSGDYSPRQTNQRLEQVRNAVNSLEELTNVPNANNEIQGYLQSGGKIQRFLEEEVVPRSKHQGVLQYLRGRLQERPLEGPIVEYYRTKQEIIEQMGQLVRGQMRLALQQPEDYTLDPITYDVFQRAVIVPSGVSYDQSILMQHFKNNGYNDPITHELYKLGEKVVVRNLALQAYIAQVNPSINRADLDYLKY